MARVAEILTVTAPKLDADGVSSILRKYVSILSLILSSKALMKILAEVDPAGNVASLSLSIAKSDSGSIYTTDNNIY